ncbi:MAG: VanW family protein [Chloroflexi bacterium]|nr:VanW family protein [Chloroflexota bacterium]
MTTATFPRRLIRPMATPPARRSTLIGFVATLLVGLLAVAGTSAAMAIATGDAVMRGVSIGGVDIGGLDRAAAIQRLEERLPSLSAGQATIVVDRSQEVVSYDAIGRRYELDAMLDGAVAVGRNGDPLADGIARLRSLVHPTALIPLVHAFDPAALDQVSTEVARRVSRSPLEAVVIRDGMAFEVRPAEDGRGLEPAAVVEALGAAVTTIDPADVVIELEAASLAPIVSTAEAHAAAAAATAMVADLELTIPDAGEDEVFAISADTIATWISFGPLADQDYAARIDAGSAGTEIAALVEAVDRDPINAWISVAGSGMGGVVAGQTGRELDIEASTDVLLATLTDRGGGAATGSLALAVNVAEPALTTEAAEAALPQMELVSSWTTTYVSNDGNGFGANISIPAQDLDGYNLAPGAWFSFWGGIGPINLERGYTYGGAIINGRSVANGALAGGICSTSTTLFNAAMRAGLEIGDRAAHYYYIDRYPTGLDATVSIYDEWVTDMTFRNDTGHPIVIRGFGTPGQVTFQMWGVPNGRTVALSDPVITNRRTATETTRVSDDLAPGTSRRVEYPHDGLDVSVSRTVTAGDGTVLHQNTWFSKYRPVNGITLVGPAAEADPADDEDEDEEGDTAGGIGDAPPEDDEP